MKSVAQTQRFILIALAICFSTALAQAGGSKKGTSAASFLTLGVDARSAALGEAYSAAVDDAAALYWNPAALTQVERRSATFMHAAYIESSYYDFGAYAQNLGRYGVVGLGAQYLTAGDIVRRDAGNIESGNFTPSDLAAIAGYARKWGPLSAGANVKFIRTKIVDTASTAAMDGGLLWSEERWKAAFTVANIGGKIKFDSESEPLPLALRAGGAFSPFKDWQFSADIVAPRDNDIYGAVGAEWRAIRTHGVAADFRAGYNSRTAGDIDGLTGLSLGTGVEYRGVSADYAFTPLGDLGDTHRISLSINF